MNALHLIIALALATLVFLFLHVRLRKRVQALEVLLKEHYWTKEIIARTYGESPLTKKEAEKKQDEQLKNIKI